MNSTLKQTAEDAMAALADAMGCHGVFTGTRRETGASASRSLSLSLRCTVSDAAPSDQTTGAVAQSSENQYTVDVGRTLWPDHTPPQAGDTVQFEGYPLLRVAAVLPAAYGWSLDCRSKGVAS